MQGTSRPPARSDEPEWLGVDEARAAILGVVEPVRGWESAPVRGAFERVLARSVVAPFDVPVHDNSAMDGYAVRAADLHPDVSAHLTVVGTALAGSAFSGVIGPGRAVRVMTGAVLPRGTDTVVIQEIVQRTGDEVVVPPGQRAGQNVRRAGEDLARESVALSRGKRLAAADVGLLASLGIAEVAVYRRPRVVFFSTGDELASIGRPLAPGEVYDSNRYTLHCALQRLNVQAIDMGVVRDDPGELEAAFRDAATQADAVITTGGVSVGDADQVRPVMARVGEMRFWRIQIKPGRPMAFGRIGAACVFGLPGNPVAVLVAFYQFVADALRRLGGEDPLPAHPILRVPCATALRRERGRREYLRGELFEADGRWQVRPAPHQGSGVLRSMSVSNCFIVLPESGGEVAPGDLVHVQPFEGLP
ncbi:MAG TPA: gephyrin-like molybdotransferase Glp [Burkholderiaceae bacterium]|nr:gephyrin-like molybdotransferase Glp [Burkholderiaceae bacterium]